MTTAGNPTDSVLWCNAATVNCSSPCKDLGIKAVCCDSECGGPEVRYAATSVENRASFSSLGNTLDGRIKPEVLAPGSPVHSARAHGRTNDGGFMQCNAASSFCTAGTAIVVTNGAVSSDGGAGGSRMLASVVHATRTHKLSEVAVWAASGRGNLTLAVAASRYSNGSYTVVAAHRFEVDVAVSGAGWMPFSDITNVLYAGVQYVSLVGGVGVGVRMQAY